MGRARVCTVLSKACVKKAAPAGRKIDAARAADIRDDKVPVDGVHVLTEESRPSSTSISRSSKVQITPDNHLSYFMLVSPVLTG